jgi:hypothetical protein
VRIPQKPDVEDLGNGFIDQLESFARQDRLNDSKAGNMPTWPRKALDQSRGDRIRHVIKYDGNYTGSFFAARTSAIVGAMITSTF